MSKINETIVMMAEQKEVFEIGNKKFQIIEVTDAEQPNVRVTMADPNAKPVEVLLEKIQPDYSHLVGKFVRCVKDTLNSHTREMWYSVKDVQGSTIIIDNNINRPVKWNISLSTVHDCFDLSNPSDTNPDEKKKILVPSEVKILNWSSLLGIGFGEDQFLYHLRGSHSYSVAPIDLTIKHVQCELIKCERSELKKGDLAFRTDNDVDTVLKDLSCYCVIINETTCCFLINGVNVFTDTSSFNHWYKVTPIEP